MSNIVELKTPNDLYKPILNGDKIVAFFYWKSCNPCKMVKKPFEDIAKEFEDSDILFIKIEMENESVFDKFEIQTVPTFIMFMDGKLFNFRLDSSGIGKLREYIKMFYL